MGLIVREILRAACTFGVIDFHILTALSLWMATWIADNDHTMQSALLDSYG